VRIGVAFGMDAGAELASLISTDDNVPGDEDETAERVNVSNQSLGMLPFTGWKRRA